MRFKLLGAHREFFQKNGYLELESLLTSEEVSSLANAADAVLEKRLSNTLEYKSADELYKVGRDIWRESDAVRKKAVSHPLVEITTELFHKKRLVLAFDQLIRTGSKPGSSQFKTATLNEISCIAPLAGALLFHLSGSPANSEFVPTSLENIVFLSPDKIIPWEVLCQLPHQSYLLIAYATPESVYVLQKKDPHTHALKKLGYVFGDRLRPDTHPFL